jgi:antitoxin FitA
VSSITIPDVDDALKARLAARAARRGKSPENEARDILREALRGEEGIGRPANLYAAIRSVMEPLGGVDLDIPPRGPVREPPQLD